MRELSSARELDSEAISGSFAMIFAMIFASRGSRITSGSWVSVVSLEIPGIVVSLEIPVSRIFSRNKKIVKSISRSLEKPYKLGGTLKERGIFPEK